MSDRQGGVMPPAALLRNGWQCFKNVLTVTWHLLCMSWLHPWNCTSLFTSTIEDRSSIEWHPSTTGTRCTPPIPTDCLFPLPSTHIGPSLKPLHLQGITPMSLGVLKAVMKSHGPGEFELDLMEWQRWALRAQTGLSPVHLQWIFSRRAQHFKYIT